MDFLCFTWINIRHKSGSVLSANQNHVGTVEQLVSQMKADADGLTMLPGTQVTVMASNTTATIFDGYLNKSATKFELRMC